MAVKWRTDRACQAQVKGKEIEGKTDERCAEEAAVRLEIDQNGQKTFTKTQENVGECGARMQEQLQSALLSLARPTTKI